MPVPEMAVFGAITGSILLAWRWLGSRARRVVLYLLMFAVPMRTRWLWEAAPEGDPSFALVFTLSFAPVFLAVLGLTHRPRGVAILGTAYFVLTWAIAFVGSGDARFEQLGVADPRLLALPAGLFALYLVYTVRLSAVRSDLDVALETTFDLQRRVHSDALTGVLNRAGVEEVLRTLHALHERVTIVLADLDRFKSINDRLGHASGDEALKVASRVFSLTVRDADLVGRWGGEEFVIVLPSLDAARSFAAAERLRAALEGHPKAREWPLTASFGVTIWEPHEPLETALAAADEALYRAKNLGRNRVEMADPPARS